MKKIILCLCMVMIFAIGTFAAETVIYENDFSNPKTLDDFVQYCQEWEIRDGGLYLTDTFLPTAEEKSLEKSFAHIIYQSSSQLTDYIVEVDYMHVQTAGGIFFRAVHAVDQHGACAVVVGGGKHFAKGAAAAEGSKAAFSGSDGVKSGLNTRVLPSLSKNL